MQTDNPQNTEDLNADISGEGQTAPDAADVAPAGDGVEAPKPGPEPTLEELFAFDPFTPPKEKTPAKAEGTPEGGTEVEPPVGEGSGNTQPPPKPQAPPAVPPNAEIAAMRAEMDALKAQLAAAQARPPQPQPPPQGTGQAPASTVSPQNEVAEIAAQYAYSVPPNIIAALRSDDDQAFGQGLAALLQANAVNVHQNLRKELAQMRDAIPTMMEMRTRQAEDSKRVNTDFYGKYPQFDRPELRPIVSNVGQQVARELGIQVWNETLRDAIATRLAQTLAAVAPTPTPVLPKPTQQRFTPQNSPPRQAQQPVDPNSASGIASIF